MDNTALIGQARLEYLSDQIRKGIPVNFNEAIEAIEYQEGLREKRESSNWNKLRNWLRRLKS